MLVVLYTSTHTTPTFVVFFINTYGCVVVLVGWRHAIVIAVTANKRHSVTVLGSVLRENFYLFIVTNVSDKWACYCLILCIIVLLAVKVIGKLFFFLINVSVLTFTSIALFSFPVNVKMFWA